MITRGVSPRSSWNSVRARRENKIGDIVTPPLHPRDFSTLEFVIGLGIYVYIIKTLWFEFFLSFETHSLVKHTGQLDAKFKDMVFSIIADFRIGCCKF